MRLQAAKISSDSERPVPKKGKAAEKPAAKKKKEALEKGKSEESLKKKKKKKKKGEEDEEASEEVPTKKKKGEEASEEVPTKKKDEEDSHEVSKKKKKGEEASQSKDGPEKEKNEPKTFARRPCPKTSPASDRWIVISQTFRKLVAPKIAEFGLYTYSYEDREVQKIILPSSFEFLDPKKSGCDLGVAFSYFLSMLPSRSLSSIW